DLVEDHALDGHLGLEGLQQVPGDGLALAVLIGGEQELVGVLQCALELGDGLGLAVGDDIVGVEVVLDVDRVLAVRLLVLGRDVLLVRQVADVTDGAEDFVAVAEVPLNRSHLRRGLDDDQLLALCQECVLSPKHTIHTALPAPAQRHVSLRRRRGGGDEGPWRRQPSGCPARARAAATGPAHAEVTRTVDVRASATHDTRVAPAAPATLAARAHGASEVRIAVDAASAAARAAASAAPAMRCAVTAAPPTAASPIDSVAETTRTPAASAVPAMRVLLSCPTCHPLPPAVREGVLRRSGGRPGPVTALRPGRSCAPAAGR